MNNPTIITNRRPYSASNVLEAVGDAIGCIKSAQHLTYTDLGAVFGKSDDVAASYRAGHSDMPLSAFVRGCATFGKPFADAALSFAGLAVVTVGNDKPSCDAGKLSPIARALSAVADCTRPDSCGGTVISDNELIENAAEIAAGFAIFRELHDRSMAALTKGRG